jgi:hypothetical protein
MPKSNYLPAAEYLRRTIEQASRYQQRLERISRKMRLRPRREARVFALFGIKGHCSHIPLSDITARIEALEIFSLRVADHLASEVKSDTPIYHGTFMDDVGLTTDREARFRLRRFRGKVDRAIRKLGLNAVVVIEVQAITNYPGRGLGYFLMLHCHAILWGSISDRKRRAAIKKLNNSRAWTNHFGLKPIKLRRLPNNIDQAQFIACYLMKLPACAKRLTKNRFGKFCLRPVETGYRDHLAFRIAEGLSHYSIYDGIFGVCDGKFIRKAWKADLQEWNRVRSESEPPMRRFSTSCLWKGVRRRHNNRGHYRPFQIG